MRPVTVMWYMTVDPLEINKPTLHILVLVSRLFLVVIGTDQQKIFILEEKVTDSVNLGESVRHYSG